ncbi:Uncharacterised protein [Nocardia farcinica]|nr:Uncharacterised protein [Nocardia farcinica]
MSSATAEFDSLEDLIVSVEEKVGEGKVRIRENFQRVSTMSEACALAREGLPDLGIEATSVANAELAALEREVELPSFSSYYDVSGADVDVARYLSGEPDCMINYQMVETPRVGRVITLVACLVTSGSTSIKEIKRHGTTLMALSLALEKVGFQTEVFGDFCTHGPRLMGRVKVRIKGPGEEFDPGKMMYAFTHPSMSRALMFGGMHLLPTPYKEDIGVGGSYGCITREPPLEPVYPEGSILIQPNMNSYGGKRDLVKETLTSLGII